jgi:hypothetical protein
MFTQKGKERQNLKIYNLHGILKVAANIYPLSSSFETNEGIPDLTWVKEESSINLTGLNRIGLRLFYNEERFVHKCRFPLDVHLVVDYSDDGVKVSFNRLYYWLRKPFQIVYAFLQMQMLDRNYSLLHCGCVSKNGRAIIFPAFSDTGKSTTSLYFAKLGYTLLGDDVIITDGKKLYSFPTAMKKRVWQPFETVPFLRKLKIQETLDFPIAEESKPSKIFFLSNDKENRIEKISREKLIANLELMMEAAFPLFPFPHGFMPGYYYARNIRFQHYLDKRKLILTELIGNCETYQVTSQEATSFPILVKQKLGD